MQLLDERVHEHKGKKFLLRLYQTADGFSVVAFLDEKPVSPSYGASFLTNADYFMQFKENITENLFRIAQSDIDVGMYFRS